MSILKKFPKHAANTASRIIDNEAVIVSPHEGKVSILNETGARIWELSNGSVDIETIIDTVSEEFDNTKEVIQEDTLELIHQLTEKQVIVLNDESNQ